MRRSYRTNATAISASITIRTTRCSLFERTKILIRRFILRVTDGIFYPGFAETFQPQETGIALAAGKAFRRRIVTTVCKRKIDTELAGFADDFRFRERDQRRVNLKARAFDTGFRSNIGQRLRMLR